MKKFLGTIVIAGALSLSSLTGSFAAPVSGYGPELDAQFSQLYDAVLAACGCPTADPDVCAAAITAYSNALIAAGVPLEVATASFQARRDAVRAAGGSAAIDAVFEALLPETEGIDDDVSPA